MAPTELGRREKLLLIHLLNMMMFVVYFLAERHYRKRKKSDEPCFAEVVEALKVSAKAITELCRNDPASRMGEVFTETVNILGEDDGTRCIRVAKIIMRDPIKISMFTSMSDDDMKKDWVLTL